MKILQRIRHYFSRVPLSFRRLDPEKAYDIWASSYDEQSDNLMLALDEELFAGLVKCEGLEDKIIVDIGCGTGRHWKKIMSCKPKKLWGVDVSAEMLKKLKQKFPCAATYRLENDRLPELENASCDCIISTLTIAHIENAEAALKEWNRVLKPGGNMIITDYHPLALAKGGRRTFKHDAEIVSIKNYVHSLDALKSIARQLDLQISRLEEKKVDDSVKHYYEKQNALPVFEIWKGVPIIYGMILKKPDAAV